MQTTKPAAAKVIVIISQTLQVGNSGHKVTTRKTAVEYNHLK